MTEEQTVSIMAAILLAKPGLNISSRDDALRCLEVAEMIVHEVAEARTPEPIPAEFAKPTAIPSPPETDLLDE